ncbi:MAG: hypothetical protein KGL35_08855 [Bradyrhizobium sp.]|nr:hypothetical protein [Bradyrhizobium sp.]
MRLLARIPTPKGPRTVSVPRLAPEDAALIGDAIAAVGGEFILREDVSSRSMPEVIVDLKRSAFRLILPPLAERAGGA